MAMKLGELKSLGHNMADSLASGIGLMIGVYEMNIFADATSSERGFVTVDFVAGKVIAGNTSTLTQRAVALYGKALPELCAKHRLNPREIRVLQAKYGVDQVYGPHFTVTVESVAGQRSTDLYVGVPGKRCRRLRHRGPV